jgi:hypothetical protein
VKLSTVGRILPNRIFARRTSETYWAALTILEPLARLLRRSNRAFAYHVAKDQARFLLGAVRPIEGETRERARAAAAWLARAQDATPDRGVSYGYFPCDPGGGNGWRPSYPETTGYIIPSLLTFAERFDDDDARRRALEMAAWEIDLQMNSGAIQGGPLCSPDVQVETAFNTGTVLHGFTAAYRVTGDVRFLAAGRRAGDFLVGDQDADGYFRSHGPFVSRGRIKTYTCLCGWALYRLGQDTGEDQYKHAALAAVEAAVRQQRPNGWFANNCIANPEAPLLHAICYTLQGILEVGMLSARKDLVEAARRGTDPLVDRISRKGFSYGSFAPDWKPAASWACLVGSAQLAIVCYRLHESTRESRYRAAADRLVNYLKALQVMDSANPAINGAIAGSFPIMGRYMTAGYPNWATKYFLDCLMLQDARQ